MSETIVLTVPAIHCGNCEAAIRSEVGSVEVDLAGRLVAVRGYGLKDEWLRAAIDEAGFDVA